MTENNYSRSRIASLSLNRPPESHLSPACSQRAHKVSASFASFAATLHESCLILEDGQCLLQACNFSVTMCLPFLVSFRLGDTPLFDLFIILHDCCELGAGSFLVGSQLRNTFV